MIIDGLNTFANGAAVAGAAAASVVVGDVIDLQATGGNPVGVGGQRDAGAGEPLWLVIKTTTPIVAAGAGTVTFSLVSDSDPALAVSPTTHFSTAALVTGATSPAPLTANGVIAIIALPVESPVYERYLGIKASIAAQAISAGAIDAFLTYDVSRYKAYPDALTV